MYFGYTRVATQIFPTTIVLIGLAMERSQTTDIGRATQRTTQRTLRHSETQRTTPHERPTHHYRPETNMQTTKTGRPPQTTVVRTSRKSIYSTDGPKTNNSSRTNVMETTFSTVHSNTTTAAIATHHFDTDPTAAETQKIGTDNKHQLIIRAIAIAVLVVAIACIAAWLCWCLTRRKKRQNTTQATNSMRSSSKPGNGSEEVDDPRVKPVMRDTNLFFGGRSRSSTMER